MSQSNTTRHHADWLSLVEVSGPFVSLPVIQRVFPHGLDPRDPAQAKALRAAYEEWQDNPTAPGKQHAWVMHVLTAVLGYPPGLLAEGQRIPAGTEANMPEMGETLRPDFALVGPSGSDTAGQAQLLIASYPNAQSLDKPVIGKHWKATPATRMMELLHGAGVPLGLVTNGEHWMLVYAPRGETTGYASWYGALWLDEPITLRAFHSLLGVRRFFGVAADNTLLALLKESASDQQEVTDQLGYQVREAVEVLVQSFDALDKESNRTLLKGVSPTGLIRRRADRHDAAGLPFLGRRARPAAPWQAALRRQLRRLHLAGAIAGSGRPLWRRSAGAPLRCLGTAARHLPRRAWRHPASRPADASLRRLAV